MEWGCMGFMLGALTAIVFVGIGVCFGRNDKRALDDDSDIRIYHPRRNSDNRCLDRYTKSEMSVVLYHLRMGASRYEKDVIDRVIEIIEGGNEE